MNKAIDDAILALAARVKNSISPDEAMKLSQAVLNLTHATATLVSTDLEKKRQ
jgi:hypothetical protein